MPVGKFKRYFCLFVCFFFPFKHILYTFISQKVDVLCGIGIKKVACGTQFSVALTKDGHVYTFGQGKISSHLHHFLYVYIIKCLPSRSIQSSEWCYPCSLATLCSYLMNLFSGTNSSPLTLK
jgi:hypothetical protein